MIGFEITGNGSHGFTWKRGAWTEGSLWLAKAALKAVPKSPESKGSAVIVDAIESQFKKLKDIVFNDVANLGLDMLLTVTGDFKFMYQFQSSRAGTQTSMELLRLIAGQSEDMGDQVMLYFCRCILDFRLHVILKDMNDLKLTVHIDL